MGRVLIAALLGAAFLGCAEPTLVGEMNRLGCSYQSTGKIVVVGSEADFGPIRVEIVQPPHTIQEIWDTIYASRPYELWYSSGYRRVEFYEHEDDNEPTLVLAVNESGATHISEPGQRSSAYPRRYRCPGLHDMLMGLLEEEYHRQHERE